MSFQKFNQDNAGGFAKMWFLPLSALVGIGFDASSGVYTINALESNFEPIYFTADSSSYKVKSKGSAYQVNIEAKHPKNRADLLDALCRFQNTPFVVLVVDNNDNYILFGDKLNYFLGTVNLNTGDKFSDFNHSLIELDRLMMRGAYFVKNPFIREIVPIPEPEPDPEPVPDPVLLQKSFELYNGPYKVANWTYTPLDNGYVFAFPLGAINQSYRPLFIASYRGIGTNTNPYSSNRIVANKNFKISFKLKWSGFAQTVPPGSSNTSDTITAVSLHFNEQLTAFYSNIINPVTSSDWVEYVFEGVSTIDITDFAIFFPATIGIYVINTDTVNIKDVLIGYYN